MKTKEELNALKEEVEVLNAKLAELTEAELEQIMGGIDFDRGFITPYFDPSQKPSNTSGENQSSTTEILQSDWRTNTPGWNQWF